MQTAAPMGVLTVLRRVLVRLACLCRHTCLCCVYQIEGKAYIRVLSDITFPSNYTVYRRRSRQAQRAGGSHGATQAACSRAGQRYGRFQRLIRERLLRCVCVCVRACVCVCVYVREACFVLTAKSIHIQRAGGSPGATQAACSRAGQ